MRNSFYISNNYTKHYYAGTQRVSSKIGTTENVGDFLQDWFTGGMGGPVDVIGSSFGVLENAEQGVVQVYDEFGIDPPTYDSSPTFIPVQNFVHGGIEVEQYFFHPDHLGSTSYITNLLGEVSQHMEYFAFGETFVEEHRSSNNSPYKFNGKELDEETGWYYYGARYYDPRISVWLSVDPLAEQTMTPYQYTYQNPINLTDPSGMAPEWIPNGDGSYTAEKGDSAGSLATQLNISQQEAENILANNGYNSIEKNGKRYSQINEGDIVSVVPDKTEIFNETLKETYKAFSVELYKFHRSMTNEGVKSGTLEYTVAKLAIFYELVTDNAPYDIKNNKNSPFYYDTKSVTGLGNYYKGKALYNGETFKFDDFGNYNYGVAARAFGITQELSEMGAGANQLKKWWDNDFKYPIGNIRTYYDDFRDNKMIKRGYNHKFIRK